MLPVSGDTFTSSINLALRGCYDDRGPQCNDDYHINRHDDDHSHRNDQGDRTYILGMVMMIMALPEAAMMIETVYIHVMRTGIVIVMMINVTCAVTMMIVVPMGVVVIVLTLHM
jgi:hypothetical protein